MTWKPILYGQHAEERLRDRGITREQVKWLLARGERERLGGEGRQTRWRRTGYLGLKEASVIFVEDATAIHIVTVIWGR